MTNTSLPPPADAPVMGVFYGVEATTDVEALLNTYAVECAGEIHAIDEVLAQSDARAVVVSGRARLVPRIEHDGDMTFCGFWLATMRGRLQGVEHLTDPWRDGHIAATLGDAESVAANWHRFVQWARRVSPGAFTRAADEWVIDTGRRRIE